MEAVSEADVETLEAVDQTATITENEVMSVNAQPTLMQTLGDQGQGPRDICINHLDIRPIK